MWKKESMAQRHSNLLAFTFNEVSAQPKVAVLTKGPQLTISVWLKGGSA